jgi:putative FmdB family regulatory protein
MPIYEYRCESCGHTLDALQKLAEAPLKDCPECEQPALKRLMSAPAFRLKGGGWYETDFKSDKEKKRNLADGGGKDGAGKDGVGKAGSEAAKSSETSKASEGSKSSESSKGSEPAKSSGSAKGDAGKSSKTKESSGGSSTAAP